MPHQPRIPITDVQTALRTLNITGDRLFDLIRAALERGLAKEARAYLNFVDMLVGPDTRRPAQERGLRKLRGGKTVFSAGATDPALGISPTETEEETSSYFMNDLKVEPLARKREGMQPVTVWNDLRVTHLPTGLAVEVPHGFTASQNRNLKTAVDMIEAVLSNAHALVEERSDDGRPRVVGGEAER